MLLSDLTEFSLSEKEAKIYLALLELEVVSVAEVAQKAATNRSSTYVILEALKKKGVVSTTGETPMERFVATSPEVLLRSAEDSAAGAQRQLDRIRGILPELKALHKDTKRRPNVRVFEGKDNNYFVIR